jgi:hypothetical protein
MDFDTYICEQTIKHAAVKFPISFPTLLSSIILDQHPSIKTVDVILHHKLFGVDHVPDIVGTSGSAPDAGMIFSGGRLFERRLKHLICLSFCFSS